MPKRWKLLKLPLKRQVQHRVFTCMVYPKLLARIRLDSIMPNDETEPLTTYSPGQSFPTGNADDALKSRTLIFTAFKCPQGVDKGRFCWMLKGSNLAY
jgi:hypothetical protein